MCVRGLENGRRNPASTGADYFPGCGSRVDFLEHLLLQSRALGNVLLNVVGRLGNSTSRFSEPQTAQGGVSSIVKPRERNAGHAASVNDRARASEAVPGS